jgi:hypothetical protein
VTGGVCTLGTTGTASWSGVPAGNLWFLIAGTMAPGSRARGGSQPGARAQGLDRVGRLLEHAPQQHRHLPLRKRRPLPSGRRPLSSVPGRAHDRPAGRRSKSAHRLRGFPCGGRFPGAADSVVPHQESTCPDERERPPSKYIVSDRRGFPFEDSSSPEDRRPSFLLLALVVLGRGGISRRSGARGTTDSRVGSPPRGRGSLPRRPRPRLPGVRTGGIPAPTTRHAHRPPGGALPRTSSIEKVDGPDPSAQAPRSSTP